MPVLFAIKEAVQSALDKARTNKLLGSSLQSNISISVNDPRVISLIKEYQDDIADLFVVSLVQLNEPSLEGTISADFEIDGAKGTVYVLPPKHEKCPRCWRYVMMAGEELCARCDSVVVKD